jgi:hypothetical protein
VNCQAKSKPRGSEARAATPFADWLASSGRRVREAVLVLNAWTVIALP